MLRMLRSATARMTAPEARRHAEFMLYRDGKEFLVINAPSMDHAQFIVAGFTGDHVWMLVERD